jgi:hypothetical protein
METQGQVDFGIDKLAARFFYRVLGFKRQFNLVQAAAQPGSSGSSTAA